MPVNSLRKATIETMSITPRRDGKVEIVLRVLAEHVGLTECASKFLRAGVESFRLLDIFKAIAPSDEDDFGLSPEPSGVGPDVLPFNSDRRVRMTGPVDVDHLSSIDAEGTTANDNREAELRSAASLTELSIHDLATLLGLLETIRQEVVKNRETFAPLLTTLAKCAAIFISASFCGHKGLMGLIDLTPTIIG